MTDGSALFEPGRNCWRVEPATRAAVIIDAADYFSAAREAMLQARHRIMLIGWDFDARIKLTSKPTEPGEPETVGEFILWLARRNPALEIFLLRWDIGALKGVFRGSTLLTVLKWMRHPRIHTKLDGIHPPGASHHQKIVVIDDCFAFCGGIDMTGDRWDTRAHRDDDPGRIRPNGDAYPPWHDASTALEGPIARALGDLARDRWRLATGDTLAPIEKACQAWPASLVPQFEDERFAISRSIPKMDAAEESREIEELYLDLIARAKRSIYAESQYFASRRVAEAIGKRLAEADPPEIVLINPHSANGWLEPLAMDTARARLFQALHRIDHRKRFRIYHPQTQAGEEIYVHAKLTVIDEDVLRVGSSNFNNRSLRLDTECDVTVAHDGPAIRAIRDGLIAEHLGCAVDDVASRIDAEGSLIAAIEGLRGGGHTLTPYEVPNLNDVETWLADNEVLDPEGPEEMFEALSGRGLFRRLKNIRRTNI